jgi:Ricin-type beta-trefoil lectin domain.
MTTIKNGIYCINFPGTNNALSVLGDGSENKTSIISCEKHGGVSQQWNIVRDSGQNNYYTITGVNSEKVMETEGADIKESNTNVEINDKNNGNNQLWVFDKIGDQYTMKNANGLFLCIDRTTNKAIGHTTEKTRFTLTKPVSDSRVVLDGVYIIGISGSDNVLDVQKDDKVNGTDVISYPKHGGYNQKWEIRLYRGDYYKITGVSSNKVMQSEWLKNKNDNSKVEIWDFNGENNQLWKIEPYEDLYMFKNEKGLSLFIDGKKVIGHPKENTKFSLTKLISNGVYMIGIRDTNNVLDVRGNGKENEDGIIAYEKHGGNNQKWTIEKQDDDFYKITGVSSGKVMESKNANNNSKVEIHGYEEERKQRQLWKIEPDGDLYTFRNGEDLYLFIDADNKAIGHTTNKTPFTLTRFTFDGIYTIDIPGTNKALESLGDIVGTHIFAREKEAAGNQRWEIRLLIDDFYTIRGVSSQMVIQSEDDIDIKKDEAKVDIRNFKSGNNQLWKIEQINDRYTFKNRDNYYLYVEKVMVIGRSNDNSEFSKFSLTKLLPDGVYLIDIPDTTDVLAVNDDSTEKDVSVCEKNKMKIQKWHIKYIKDNLYEISIDSHGIVCMAIKSDDKENSNTNVVIEAYNKEKNNQLWKIEQNFDGQYTFKNNNGLYLYIGNNNEVIGHAKNKTKFILETTFRFCATSDLHVKKANDKNKLWENLKKAFENLTNVPEFFAICGDLTDSTNSVEVNDIKRQFKDFEKENSSTVICEGFGNHDCNKRVGRDNIGRNIVKGRQKNREKRKKDWNWKKDEKYKYHYTWEITLKDDKGITHHIHFFVLNNVPGKGVDDTASENPDERNPFNSLTFLEVHLKAIDKLIENEEKVNIKDKHYFCLFFHVNFNSENLNDGIERWWPSKKRDEFYDVVKKAKTQYITSFFGHYHSGGFTKESLTHLSNNKYIVINKENQGILTGFLCRCSGGNGQEFMYMVDISVINGNLDFIIVPKYILNNGKMEDVDINDI